MNNRIFGSNLFPAVAVIAMLALGGTGTAVAGNGADDFVRSIGQQAINSLTGKELSDDQRRAGFRTILKSNFELPLVARFTLGRFWRRASETQRKEFVGLFEDYLVETYAALFRDYNGESFTVGKVREINKSDVAVKSAVTLNDGQKIEVYWRVRGKEDPKIIDVIVEGVSMVITQRDEFSAILNQNDGKFDGLLTALRKRAGK